MTAGKAYCSLRPVTSHLPSRLFRLFCAVAVAFVTTFHVCGIATASATPPVALHAPVADDGPSDEGSLPGEKCHVCATVSLPAPTPAEESLPERIAVRQAPARDLVSLHTALALPPPKT